MKWFKNVFFPSLIEKIEKSDKSYIWLSERQTAICYRYMEMSRYFNFSYIIIENYQYNLTIMKKGYGKLEKHDKDIAYH